MSKPTKNDAIKLILETMAENLSKASILAVDASEVLANDTNLAIGMITELDELLSTAQALHKTALTFHRMA